MVEEENNRNNDCTETEYVVEEDPQQVRAGDVAVVDDEHDCCSDGCQTDVLELDCEDKEIYDTELSDCESIDAQRHKIDESVATYAHARNESVPTGRVFVNRRKMALTTEAPAKPRTGRRGRRARGQHPTLLARPVSKNGKWNVRWTRDGFEHLLYAVCNCNEEPNVVFAGLCYQRADVYTMLLRNCNGKRRYWYDLSTRRTQFDETDNRSDDFERAMVWRSKVIGRSCTTPGYDLASFALQNVTTDRRSYGGMATSLILITTGDMLSETSINRQLVCSAKELMSYGSTQHHVSTRFSIDRRQRQRNLSRSQTPACCRVCSKAAKTVTQDNASIPTFLCWDHSAVHMAGSSGDRTRVYDAVVLDLQFSRDPGANEVTCRVRLINDDSLNTRFGQVVSRSGALPIAELVLQPSAYHGQPLYGSNKRTPLEPAPEVDLKTAHGYICREMHYDDGDLFPSMPGHSVGGGSTAGTARYHDTTLGRVVDRSYCVVSKFQS